MKKKTTNTRTASGTGSIRQRPDGRWEGRLIVGYDPGTGKPIRRSIYGDTQKAVRQEMTSIQRALDNGTYQPPVKLTVGAWLDMWMETFCASTVKPLTYSAYETAIKNHIKPSIGATKLQILKGVDIHR